MAGGVFIVDEDDAKQRDAGGWGEGAVPVRLGTVDGAYAERTRSEWTGINKAAKKNMGVGSGDIAPKSGCLALSEKKI